MNGGTELRVRKAGRAHLGRSHERPSRTDVAIEANSRTLLRETSILTDAPALDPGKVQSREHGWHSFGTSSTSLVRYVALGSRNRYVIRSTGRERRQRDVAHKRPLMSRQKFEKGLNVVQSAPQNVQGKVRECATR